MSLEETIKNRLTSVRERITRAAERSRRDPSSVRLIAVSKTFSIEYVHAAAAAGQVDFGENRVQEATDKIEHARPGLCWHLIGHLQTNKARKAAASFPYIHSIDGEDLLRRIDRAAEEAGTTPTLLIQADLAGEATKHGAAPDELPAIFRAASECRTARVAGLMVLPPFFDDPEATRPYFQRLRELREQLLADGVRPDLLQQLSMGMSHDFEVAVEEGATMVRVGTAIFGGRS